MHVLEPHSKLTADSRHDSLLIRLVDISQTLAHHQTQLYLEMHVDTARSEYRTFAGEKDRAWRLKEEEWLFRTGVIELGNVVANESS